MKYKLLDTGQGILEDRTSIFFDINGNCELPFLMPSEGRYVGIFTDRRNVRLKEEFKEDVLKVPAAFTVPGLYQLQVVKIDEAGQVLKTWDCEPIKILSLDRNLKTEFELIGAASEEDIRQQMSTSLTDIAGLKASVSVLAEESKQTDKTLSEVIERYNEAIKVINDLAERVASLEAEGDPTIIKSKNMIKELTKHE